MISKLRQVKPGLYTAQIRSSGPRPFGELMKAIANPPIKELQQAINKSMRQAMTDIHVSVPEPTPIRTDIVVNWWKHEDGREQPFGYHTIDARNKEVITSGEPLANRAHITRMAKKLYGPVELRKIDPPAKRKSRNRA